MKYRSHRHGKNRRITLDMDANIVNKKACQYDDNYMY